MIAPNSPWLWSWRLSPWLWNSLAPSPSDGSRKTRYVMLAPGAAKLLGSLPTAPPALVDSYATPWTWIETGGAACGVVESSGSGPCVSRFVKLMTTQSPRLARRTSGWIGSSRSPVVTRPDDSWFRTAWMFWSSTYMNALGSLSPKWLYVIFRLIAETLNVFVGVELDVQGSLAACTFRAAGSPPPVIAKLTSTAAPVTATTRPCCQR